MSVDLKNIREAVAIFDELRLDLEVLKTQLDDNFKNYQSIGDVSSQNIDKFQDVLQSINTLQINAESSVKVALKSTHELKHEMGEYYSQEFINTKKILDALLSEVNNAFYNLKKTINDSIENGINDVVIDTSKLEAKVAKTLDQVNLFEFRKSVDKLEDTNTDFIHASNTLIRSSQNIETTTDTINQSIKGINTVNKSLTMAITLSLATFFTFLGFSLATYFKIDALSDYYFSDYKQKLEVLKAAQGTTDFKISKLNKLSKYIYENNINISINYFDTGKPYMAIRKNATIKDKDGDTSYTSTDGTTIIRLKSF
jgi:hypothetical protein